MISVIFTDQSRFQNVHLLCDIVSAIEFAGYIVVILV